MNLSIVIPLLNEEDSLEELLVDPGAKLRDEDQCTTVIGCRLEWGWHRSEIEAYFEIIVVINVKFGSREAQGETGFF